MICIKDLLSSSINSKKQPETFATIVKISITGYTKKVI